MIVGIFQDRKKNPIVEEEKYLSKILVVILIKL